MNEAPMRRWDFGHVQQAIEMRRRRMSAAQIAAVLGRSRAAVIKKLWEAGEPGVLVSQYGRANLDARGEPLVRRYSWEADDV